MTLFDIYTYFDWILFIVISLTALYLTIFSVASLIQRHSDMPKGKRENRFIVVIPSYNNGRSLELTVKSILGQSYPQRLFDVTVVADHENEMTLFHLAQEPVTLLTPNFEKTSRTKQLQLAINNLPQFKIYDIVVILEAGDLVDTEFLYQVNDAYEAAGTKAIQFHKLSLNRDTTSARLDAVFEEINNSIFRRGHITLGLSSALASSGMCYDFAWFKQSIATAKVSWEEKELEARLARQYIYVDYFDDILVYSEKVRHADDFNRQHRYWMVSQVQAIFRNVRYLPIALINRQYNLVDKLLQWLLIPRMAMVLIIVFMGIITPFIYFTIALKWWALFSIVLFDFALATPNYLVDDKWDSTFFKMPFVLLDNLLNRFKLGRIIVEKVNLKS